MKYKYCLLVGATFWGLHNRGYAQDYFNPSLCSFEEKTISSEWLQNRNTDLSITSEHFRHGTHSLQWTWHKSTPLILNRNIDYTPFDPNAKEKTLSTFVVWIYNENPIKDDLQFVFKEKNKEKCNFTFHLNFKGWRCAWVAFDRDMKGVPSEYMDQLEIIPPKSIEKGTLCIDHLITSIPYDSRQHSPDHQVPFVNPNTDNHWLRLERVSHYKPDIASQNLTQTQKSGIAQIEERYRNDLYHPISTSENLWNKLKKEAQKYHIERTDVGIKGTPIWFVRNYELYGAWSGREPFLSMKKSPYSIKQYFLLMKKIAIFWASASNENLKEKSGNLFIDLFDNIEEQGFAYGSAIGTIHHYGYSWRDYYNSLYIAKELLQTNNRLDRAVKGMQWYAGTGEVYTKPQNTGMSLDAFNTVAMGRLGSILIMPDSPEKVQKLKCFSRWIDNGLQIANGLDGSFKKDGSMFHHCNNYPAYAVGGLDGATRMVYFFSKTPFAVSSQGHENIKKALVMMSRYCNLREWPVSMSGRHPMVSAKRNSLHSIHYALLALSGTPDRKENIDKEMAAIYMRVSEGEKRDQYGKAIMHMGTVAEDSPQGNWNLPYASIDIHRRENWSAVVRGHSRYLWSAEQYIGANYYGRYMGYGSLQINNVPQGNKENGYNGKGWDWSRFPGVTAIHLPVDSMLADIRNVDTFSGFEEMLYSDESFAGGISDSRNGIYAFKLHEHDKYNGTLRAKKSYFFIDNCILCLGSGIQNQNTKFPTETTLFQVSLEDDTKSTLYLNKKIKNGKHLYSSKNSWIIDPLGNGYLLLGDQNLRIEQGEHKSKDQGSKKETIGTFSTAVLDHGTNPRNANYSYMIYVNSNPKEMNSMTQKAVHKILSYEIIRQDNHIHCVKDKRSNIENYVFFDAGEYHIENIESVDTPCIIRLSKQDDKMKLSVVDPDLHLYNGDSDELFDKNNKRTERSIYSRPWIHNKGEKSELTIVLNGSWKGENCTCQNITDNKTKVTVFCENGDPTNIELLPIGKQNSKI